VTPEPIITSSALIAAFAGLLTILVFQRRTSSAAAATDLNTSKD
jgi:hypothetical protein